MKRKKFCKPTAKSQYPHIPVTEGREPLALLQVALTIVAALGLVPTIGLLTNKLVSAIALGDRWSNATKWGPWIVSLIALVWCAIGIYWLITKLGLIEVKEYETVVLRNRITGNMRKLCMGTWFKLYWETPTREDPFHMGYNTPVIVEEAFSLRKGGTASFKANVPWYRRYEDVQDTVRLGENYIVKRISGHLTSTARDKIQARSAEELQKPGEQAKIRGEIETEWVGTKEAKIEKELGCNLGELQILVLRASDETQAMLNKQLEGKSTALAAQAIQTSGVEKWQVDAVLADQEKITRNVDEQTVKVEGAEGADRLVSLILGAVNAFRGQHGHGGGTTRQNTAIETDNKQGSEQEGGHR
jgi:hypothetical protein